MQRVQNSPNQAIRRGQIKHPGDAVVQELHKPTEILPDCDPRLQPPPRHPARLLRTHSPPVMNRPRSPPMQLVPSETPPVPKRVQSKQAQTTVHEIHVGSSDDDQLAPMASQYRPTSRSGRQHPPRQRGGSNGSLGHPRWSAFPSPPEGPPQPPPTRPLPQLPSTPTTSSRSRKSSGASKRSTGPPNHGPGPAYGPNTFPPSPPQEFLSDVNHSQHPAFSSNDNAQHSRHYSSQSSASHTSSQRTNSLTGYPSYGTATILPGHPAPPNTPPQLHPRYMTTLEERVIEDEPSIHRLTSVSVRSSNSADKHSSSNGRRMSTSTHSSEGATQQKKSGLFGGKGLKSLVKAKSPPLVEAVKSNDLRGLLDLLAPGRNPPDINETDKDKWTALHWAADMGYMDIAEVLLARNAKTEARTKTKERTPLFQAAAHGHAQMVTLLAEHGAAVNSASKYDGATAIHKAAQHGHVEVIMALIAAKADVNKRDIEGMPPLMWATQSRQLHAAHKLVAAGADLEIRIKRGANLESSSIEGLTVLHKVAGTGEVAFAKLFLEHGADANADAPNGFRALHKAASKGDLEMCMVLVEYGADVNLRGSEGWAPLHFAARHGHRRLCLFLVRQGADATMRIGKHGTAADQETPAELGSKHGYDNLFD